MTQHPDTETSLRKLRADVRALLDEWVRQERYVPSCDAWMRMHDLNFTKELAARRWIGMTWPAQLGGGGRSHLARLVVTEELLRGGAPVAAHWMADRQIGPAILRCGDAELQSEFLPGICAGEVTFCLGMSETEAGSDLAAVRTRAERDGDDWIINGAKVWTTNAHRSTHAYVLARSENCEHKHEGLTEFLVDMSAPGVSVRPIYDLAGQHHFNETILDEVRVPGRWVLGQVGNGWRQVTEQLSFERGGAERYLSTYPLLAAVLREASRHSDRAVTEKVGALVARLAGLRGLATVVAEASDAGQAPVSMAAKLKYLGTTFERDVVDLARYVVDLLEIDGDSDIVELLRHAVFAIPGASIRGGASEVLLALIARAEAT